MQVTIDLNPTHEAQLVAAAEAEGLAPPALARKLVTEHLSARPPRPTENGTAIDAESQAAIDLLQSWLDHGKTATPEDIALADAELEELKRNLNANRAATGERLVFP